MYVMTFSVFRRKDASIPRKLTSVCFNSDCPGPMGIGSVTRVSAQFFSVSSAAKIMSNHEGTPNSSLCRILFFMFSPSSFTFHVQNKGGIVWSLRVQLAFVNMCNS